ncbi:hypothetical protein FQN49_000010 [Arthroderma sp. PD_2]|nr:hypothetical protein FQN49_000010 [Arthroderma sp. PD_2]
MCPIQRREFLLAEHVCSVIGRGTLNLIFKPEWRKPGVDKGGIRMEFRRHAVNNLKSNPQPHLLDPLAFKALAKNNDISESDAHLVLPRVIAMIGITRSMISPSIFIKEEDLLIRKIGENIPKYAISTVEVTAVGEAKRVYEKTHARLAEVIAATSTRTKTGRVADYPMQLSRKNWTNFMNRCRVDKRKSELGRRHSAIVARLSTIL